jgi:hypothetical protein
MNIPFWVRVAPAKQVTHSSSFVLSPHHIELTPFYAPSPTVLMAPLVDVHNAPSTKTAKKKAPSKPKAPTKAQVEAENARLKEELAAAQGKYISSFFCRFSHLLSHLSCKYTIGLACEIDGEEEEEEEEEETSTAQAPSAETDRKTLGKV